MSQPIASETSQAATSRRVERAVREVVERPLADGRLVDRVDELASAAPGPGRRGVTRTNSALLVDPTMPPDDLDLAVAQDVERRRRGRASRRSRSA